MQHALQCGLGGHLADPVNSSVLVPLRLKSGGLQPLGLLANPLRARLARLVFIHTHLAAASQLATRRLFAVPICERRSREPLSPGATEPHLHSVHLRRNLVGGFLLRPSVHPILKGDGSDFVRIFVPRYAVRTGTGAFPLLFSVQSKISTGVALQ